MNQENTNKLYNAFSNLYRGRFNLESSMQRGFQCDDGWFQIIWNFSTEIESFTRGLGIDYTDKSWPEVIEVKQKFGELRIVLSRFKDSEPVLHATACSKITCEICGNEGSDVPSIGRGRKILCTKHTKEFLAKNDSSSAN